MRLEVRGKVQEYAQVDTETGEVLESERRFRIVRTKVSDTVTIEPWSRMFDSTISAMSELSKTQIVILLHLVKYSDAENSVKINQAQRDTICNAAQIKRQSLNNAISSLVALGGYIRSRERNAYTLSPHLFWRGTEKSLLEAIKTWDNPS